ncbi:hypothetical protein DFJ74DRAFT_732964, partial [Hyaloraphidium curvatum]
SKVREPLVHRQQPFKLPRAPDAHVLAPLLRRRRVREVHRPADLAAADPLPAEHLARQRGHRGADGAHAAQQLERADADLRAALDLGERGVGGGGVRREGGADGRGKGRVQAAHGKQGGVGRELVDDGGEAEEVLEQLGVRQSVGQQVGVDAPRGKLGKESAAAGAQGLGGALGVLPQDGAERRVQFQAQKEDHQEPGHLGVRHGGRPHGRRVEREKVGGVAVLREAAGGGGVRVADLQDGGVQRGAVPEELRQRGRQGQGGRGGRVGGELGGGGEPGFAARDEEAVHLAAEHETQPHQDLAAGGQLRGERGEHGRAGWVGGVQHEEAQRLGDHGHGGAAPARVEPRLLRGLPHRRRGDRRQPEHLEVHAQAVALARPLLADPLPEQAEVHQPLPRVVGAPVGAQGGELARGQGGVPDARAARGGEVLGPGGRVRGAHVLAHVSPAHEQKVGEVVDFPAEPVQALVEGPQVEVCQGGKGLDARALAAVEQRHDLALCALEQRGLERDDGVGHLLAGHGDGCQQHRAEHQHGRRVWAQQLAVVDDGRVRHCARQEELRAAQPEGVHVGQREVGRRLPVGRPQRQQRQRVGVGVVGQRRRRRESAVQAGERGGRGGRRAPRRLPRVGAPATAPRAAAARPLRPSRFRTVRGSLSALRAPRPPRPLGAPLARRRPHALHPPRRAPHAAAVGRRLAQPARLRAALARRPEPHAGVHGAERAAGRRRRSR